MFSFLLRICTAMLATIAGSALCGAIIIIVVFSIIEPPVEMPVVLHALIMFVPVFLSGLLVAAIPAVIIGLFWELPLALLRRRHGSISLPAHIASSAVVGGGLILAILSSPIGHADGTPFFALIGAAGGVCSALAWTRFTRPI